MTGLLLTLWMGGLRLTVPEGLPAAPLDLEAGVQRVELRAPLIARTVDARLVLMVREPLAENVQLGYGIAGFEQAVPRGSVRARLHSDGGGTLELEHSDYLYHRGYRGLVLTEVQPGRGNVRYGDLEIESDVRLPGVRLVWLDRRGRRIQDLGFR